MDTNWSNKPLSVNTCLILTKISSRSFAYEKKLAVMFIQSRYIIITGLSFALQRDFYNNNGTAIYRLEFWFNIICGFYGWITIMAWKKSFLTLNITNTVEPRKCRYNLPVLMLCMLLLSNLTKQQYKLTNKLLLVLRNTPLLLISSS